MSAGKRKGAPTQRRVSLLRAEPPSLRQPANAPAWWIRRTGGGETIAHLSNKLDKDGKIVGTKVHRYGRTVSEGGYTRTRDGYIIKRERDIAKRGRPSRVLPDDALTARNRASTKAITLQLGSAATPQRVGGVRSGQVRREGGKAGAILAAAAGLPAKTKPHDVAQSVVDKLAAKGITVSLRHVRRVLYPPKVQRRVQHGAGRHARAGAKSLR